jgi:hypothetical protein
MVDISKLSTRDIEQRISVLNSQITETRRNIENARKSAENPKYTSAQRADSKRFYDEQNQKLADLTKELSDFENQVKEGANAARSEFLRGEIAELRKRYNLKLDKGGKEATALKSEISRKEDELKKIEPKTTAFTPRVVPQETVVSQPPQMVGQVPVTTGTKTEIAAPTPTPTPTPTPEPTAGESKVPTAGKKGVKGKKEEKPAPAQDLETILAKTEFWYDLPDYIFTTVPELGGLLVQAVNENWDENKFLSKAKLTPWWQSKTNVFRNRVISKGKYDELKASGVDTSQTEYGQFLSNQMRSVKSRAKQIAGVTLDDAQAQQVAEKIWNGNLDGDTLAIDRLIVPFIGKVTDLYAKSPVTTYGGQALQNYQTLQAIAKANGLNLKDILPQISTTTTGGDIEKAVLQGLASGDIDINKVNQSARMIAAQGQPEYVRNLLNQGYDLEQIYAPYKQVMSSILEITPDQIDLNDPTLRGAINNNGDMNVYDFKKALRKDARWQYTEGANKEMTGLAQDLLRNFGFVG